jgi:hypothetical protein
MPMQRRRLISNDFIASLVSLFIATETGSETETETVSEQSEFYNTIEYCDLLTNKSLLRLVVGKATGFIGFYHGIGKLTLKT